MHHIRFLLAATALLPSALAERGNAPNVTPTVCNYEPNAISTTVVVQTLTVVPIPASKRDAQPTHVSVPAPKQESQLEKRQGAVTYSNCDKPAPGNTWTDAGFDTMADVLKEAYKDAVTLATSAQNVANDNKGFTHYFGGDYPELQLAHFHDMMSGVAGGTNYYSIVFECENIPSCAGGKSIMVTDASSGSPTDVKTIEVCGLFFTAPSTKYLLFENGKPSSRPPYRDDSSNGWCRKSNGNGDSNVSARSANFFSTAGHSILHELTHLDSLAEQAGLDADEGLHGTLDAQDGCEMDGARKFLQKYMNKDTEGTSPDYNAESYAAAATEIYFMQLCGFSQIRPLT